MSLTSISVKNHISELKEMLGMVLRQHGHEIIISGIMVGISIAITASVTGSFNDALAGPRRR
jgi:hypothetical protein